MAKYNLSVAVMQDDEPIMFLYSQDYNEGVWVDDTFYRNTYNALANLKTHFPSFDWGKICGEDSDEINETPTYVEFKFKPDKERDDMYLLAIWQKMED